MKKTILILIFQITTVAVFSQSKKYSDYIKIADSLGRVNNFQEAAMAYNKAFQVNDWKGFTNDRYNAACNWAKANQADSAFLQLEKIATKLKFRNYQLITNDKDFISLYKDERWKSVLSIIKKNYDEYENYSNKPLRYLIDSLRNIDQVWRNRSTMTSNKTLVENFTKEEISKNLRQTDSLNYFEIKKIISKYGYPNSDLIGMEGSHNFWLIVQHQDRHPIFQDSILRLMKIEVDLKKASGQDYAYLIDRVKCNTGEKQIYGTQMILNKDSSSFEMKNCINPESVNERRKNVGLNSIEEYTQIMHQMYKGIIRKK